MDHLTLALSLLTLLVPGSYAVCNSQTPLPHRYAGQVLSTGGTCPTAQEQAAAVDQVTDDINQLIDSLLPQLQHSLSPSPCEGLGWTKVAHLDMTNSSHTCPQGWRVDTFSGGKRLCRRTSTTSDCSAVQFSTNGVEYSRVCGKIRAYQYGEPEAFQEFAVHGRGLSEHYVDGVIVTRGSPMEHVWTLAAGRDETTWNTNAVCPCVSEAAISVPAFVGQHYFCESGTVSQPDRAELFSTDPLWDGQGCGSNSDCCTFNNPPYFSVSLPLSTCDDLAVRICASSASDEDVPVELVELYVK